MSDTHKTPDEGEILKANRLGPDQVRVGMDVVGIDGEMVGKVKEVRAEDFLLDRPFARDLYVPYRFVVAAEDYGGTFRRGPVEASEIVLSMSAAHLDSQGFQHA